ASAARPQAYGAEWPDAVQDLRLPGTARTGQHARSGVDCLNFSVVRADEEPGGPTAVGQDYLKVIWNAQEWSMEKVSTKMLADRLGEAPSTPSEAIEQPPQL